MGAGNVLVGLALGSFNGFSGLGVVDPNGHERIGLTGLGVLENIGFRIQVGAVHIHAEFGHPAFIKAVVGQIAAVGRPRKGHVEAKFLFVDPVGGAVDDGVFHAV